VYRSGTRGLDTERGGSVWVEGIVRPVRVSRYYVGGAREVFNVLLGEFMALDTMWAIVEASFNSGNYRWEYHFTVTSGEDGLTKEHIRAVGRIARKHGLKYDYVIVADEKRYVYMYITFTSRE
jgi:hypothetical protein